VGRGTEPASLQTLQIDPRRRGNGSRPHAA
jgi:hypothetical protein